VFKGITLVNKGVSLKMQCRLQIADMEFTGNLDQLLSDSGVPRFLQYTEPILSTGSVNLRIKSLLLEHLIPLPVIAPRREHILLVNYKWNAEKQDS